MSEDFHRKSRGLIAEIIPESLSHYIHWSKAVTLLSLIYTIVDATPESADEGNRASCALQDVASTSAPRPVSSEWLVSD